MIPTPAPVCLLETDDRAQVRPLAPGAAVNLIRSNSLDRAKSNAILPHSSVCITEDDVQSRVMLVTFGSKPDGSAGACRVFTVDAPALRRFFRVDGVHHKEFPVLPLALDVVSYDTRDCPVTTSLGVYTTFGTLGRTGVMRQASGRRWWARQYGQEKSDSKEGDVVVTGDSDALLLRNTLWNPETQTMRLFHYDHEALSDRWRRSIMTMPLTSLCNTHAPARVAADAETNVPIVYVRPEQPVSGPAFLCVHRPTDVRRINTAAHVPSLTVPTQALYDTIKEERAFANHDTHCIAHDAKMEICLYTCDPKAQVGNASIEVQLRFQWVYVPDCDAPVQ